jgi:hypothetical protein
LNCDRRCEACSAIEMTPAELALIGQKLHLCWSPEQISEWLLEERYQWRGSNGKTSRGSDQRARQY